MIPALVVGVWIAVGFVFYAFRRRAGRRSQSLSLLDSGTEHG